MDAPASYHSHKKGIDRLEGILDQDPEDTSTQATSEYIRCKH